MAKDLHKPAGYCPHCEYPIDPGTCPECGAEVSREALASSPASIRRRRVVRGSIIAAALSLVLASGVYVHARFEWIRWVPTNLLLPFQGDFNGGVGIELRRRLGLNRLTNRQSQRILEHHIDDPLLSCHREHPRGVPIKLTINYQYRNDVFSVHPGSPSIGDFTLWVDGDEVRPLSQRDLEAVYHMHPRSDRDSVWCPPLDEGQHQITLEGDFHHRWSYKNSKPIIYTHHARLSHDIEVKGDVLDYVAMIGTSAAARRMRGSIHAVFRSQSYLGPKLFFYVRSQLRSSVAGQVLVRRRGEVGFVHVGHIFLRKTRQSSAAVNLDALPGIEEAEWIAVRVVPDPDVACLNHATACFDGVLMWERVTVSDGTRTWRIPLNHIVLNQTVGG